MCTTNTTANNMNKTVFISPNPTDTPPKTNTTANNMSKTVFISPNPTDTPPD